MIEEDSKNIYSQSAYNVRRDFYNDWNNGYQNTKKKNKTMIVLLVFAILVCSIFIVSLFIKSYSGKTRNF